MYIYHCLCFQSIQFTWKQVGQARWCYTEFYICGSCNLVSIFFSSCDISKTVFVIKYDGFYLSICWGYLLWERVVFLTWNLFLWWICFCTKVSCSLFWKDRKQSTIFEKCMITLILVWWLYEGGYIVSIIVTFDYQIFMVFTSFGCNVIFHTFECF